MACSLLLPSSSKKHPQLKQNNPTLPKSSSVSSSSLWHIPGWIGIWEELHYYLLTRETWNCMSHGKKILFITLVFIMYVYKTPFPYEQTPAQIEASREIQSRQTNQWDPQFVVGVCSHKVLWNITVEEINLSSYAKLNWEPITVLKADHFVQKKKVYSSCHPPLNQYCRNTSVQDIVVLKIPAFHET